MRLYHSSNMIVEHPDTQHSRRYLDFGRGFYLTSLHEHSCPEVFVNRVRAIAAK